MAARDDDHRGGMADGSPGTPATRSRVFVWGEVPRDRTLFQRLVDRLRGSDGGTGHDSPTVIRPSVSHGGPGAPTPVAREAPVPELPPVDDGWEPPDLSVDEPPASESAPSGSGSDAPSEDQGHGPGPLYRATLQLLPGRLRPLDPDIVREEIRFVRPSGRAAVVTLGWAEGEPPDHITVNHPSVQDRHARMSFVDRRWRIESLVGSHPVRVNGEAVPAGAEPRELQSGDEVRMGDASFHFLMP